MDEPEKPSFRYTYVIIAACFFVWTAVFGALNTFSLFLKPIALEFGVTRAEVSLAFSLSLIIQAVLSPLIGSLRNKIGSRLVITLLGSFLGLSFLLMSQVENIRQFQLSYVIFTSIGMSAIVVPIMVTITHWVTKRRGLIIGIVSSGSGVGAITIAPVTSLLISNHGWRFAYVILGLIVIFIVITSGLFLKRAPSEKSKFVKEASPDKRTGKIRSYYDKIINGLAKTVSAPRFWVLAFLYFTFGYCRSSIIPHIAAYVQDLGFSIIYGGNIIAVLIGVSMIGRITAGRAADIIGDRFVFMVSYSISGAILIWAIFARDIWALYLFAAVFGFGWGAQAVIRFSLVSKSVSTDSLGIVLGILLIVEAIAASLGSYYSGHIFDVTGSYILAFIICAGLSVVSVFICCGVRSYESTGNSESSA